jgi:flavin-dependent dehydrogenase
MSPETVRILARLGALEPIEQAGAIGLEGLKVTAPQGAEAYGRFALASHRPFRATGLSVSRRILDHELLKAARRAGAGVFEQAYIEELLYDRGAVTGAVIRDRSGLRHSVRARLTVGADGLRSIVARKMGRRTYGLPRRIAFVTHVAGVTGMTKMAELHFGGAGYVGLNPVGSDVTNVGLVVPVEHAAQARSGLEAFFYRTLGAFPGVAERVARGALAGPILATGPFAARSSRVTTRGALLVGDAADFFDPFTGDGIHSALRGAELILETMVPTLSGSGPVTAEALGEYRRMRRRAFAGKWIMERLVGYAMYFPRVFERGIARLGRRESMAHTMVGVAGGFVPAREALNPWFLARMVL